MKADPKDLEPLFTSLRHIWETTRDGGKIADFYGTPCGVLRGNGAFVCLQTQDDVARFFQSAIDGFCRDGYVRLRHRDFSVQALGRRAALVTLTWQFFRKQEGAAVEIKQSYSMVHLDNAWKIVLSVIHLAE